MCDSAHCNALQVCVDGACCLCSDLHMQFLSQRDTQLPANCLLSGPPFFLTVSPSPVYIAEHQQKHIDCVAAGDPYPSISWTRVNGTLPPYTTWNHAGMTLTALEGSDVSGVYVCKATNINGVAERVFEVLYTSSITEPPTTAPTTIPTESQGINTVMHLILKVIPPVQ